MNFRQNPIAITIAMALAGARGEALAVSRQEARPTHVPTEAVVSPFDDAGVTLLGDEWEDDGEAFLGLEMFDGGDPFAIAGLREEGVAMLSAYGSTTSYGSKAKCHGSRPYGTAKLTVVLPSVKGNLIYGDGINCGKSVPKKAAYGSGTSTRVCSLKTCKSYGDTVNLTAKPADGWTFVKWLGACKSAGTESTCSVDLTKSRKVSAKFRRAK